jgi:hypothetical protein
MMRHTHKYTFKKKQFLYPFDAYKKKLGMMKIYFEKVTLNVQINQRFFIFVFIRFELRHTGREREKESQQ